MNPSADVYTHGHSTSVVSAHATRTVANSAAYLNSYLKPGSSVLDVGCGPGTITAEIADLVAPARVLGVDLAETVITEARERFNGALVEFETMNSYELDIADNSFDIAHAHQVLQHVTDPVAILQEMRRVVQPGGIVAARDADYAAMHWSPNFPGLELWLDLYRQVARRNDAEPDAGRHLLRWARQLDFSSVEPSVSTWLFASPAQTTWWGTSWSERVLTSSFADQAMTYGLATQPELARISQAWIDWANDPDAWFVVVHGEILCTV